MSPLLSCPFGGAVVTFLSTQFMQTVASHLRNCRQFARRARLSAAAALALTTVLVAWSAPAVSQTWPEKPLRIIHAGANGSGGDLMSRLIAQHLGERLGQPVVVDGRPGAFQAVAMTAAARAPADGYTLAVLNAGLSVSTALNPKLPYDLFEDFSFVTLVSNFPFAIAVASDSPLRTAAELIAAARKGPGTLTYATQGVGTTQNLVGELLNHTAKVSIVHVPYASSAGPMVDLLAGRVSIIIENLTSALPQARAGKLRILAVTSSKRWPTLPDVPALSEILPGFEAVSWFGVGVPAHTPPTVIERLNQEFRVLSQNESFKRGLEGLGNLPLSTSPSEMRTHVSQEVAKWREIARIANIKLQ